VRPLLLLAIAFPLLAQDAHEIVRRAVELDRNNGDNWRNFTYVQRQIDRQFEGSGKVKSEADRTWDVTFQEGSPYRRLIARNGVPLSPQEQQAEDEKMQRNIGERRNETKEQRDRRASEWRRRLDRQREPLNEVPDAFDFRIAGEEPLKGGDAWVIDGSPKAHYKPKSSAASILQKMKTRLWISKRDYHWIKLDAEMLDTFTYGTFLLRIGKGAHITMEQARVNGDVWLPTRIALAGSARILLVKGIRAQLDIAYSDYKKFVVNSRVVPPTGEK
jgi:hypothetical protein